MFILNLSETDERTLKANIITKRIIKKHVEHDAMIGQNEIYLWL